MLVRPVVPASSTSSPDPLLVGHSDAIQKVVAMARRVAPGNAKILITGESGVGKEIVARLIHAHSDRASRPFVAINCGGMTDTLLESELFGHVRGSFTGAFRDKPGKLQLGHGGTVFLDEFGEMSPRMQALLLRFLESGELQPVGSDRACSFVDVRTIAATNRDLRSMVEAGEFREDLLYRINVVHIHIPPLRERPEDIPDIVTHLLARYGSSLVISTAAMTRLQQYHWPGNVRELQNAIEQIVLLTDGLLVLPEALPASVLGGGTERHDRRRSMADDLFEGLVSGRCGFWSHVHALFMARDLTRNDLRQVVRLGLAESRGSYRGLVRVFRLPPSDYKRLVSFLAAHDCRVDFREYRPSFPRTVAADADVEADPVTERSVAHPPHVRSAGTPRAS